MNPAIIYTVLGIQGVVLSAFIWVIDGRAESRSNTQRAENVIKIAEVKTAVNSLDYRINTMEEKLDDVAVVWTLQDVIDVVKASDEDMKRYIGYQYRKLTDEEKKKYDIFYVEHDHKLFKVYAIETEEDKWLTMKTVEVENYEND